MTGVSSSAPLPGREGQGVGIAASAASEPLAAGRGTSLGAQTRAPTPGPSLQAGRGVEGDTSRLKSSTNLKAAGEKFEAVFTGMMLKSMRHAKLADPLFDSKAIDTFSEMQDAKVAQAMAEHAPLGIGKAMTDFLARSQSDLNPGAPHTGE